MPDRAATFWTNQNRVTMSDIVKNLDGMDWGLIASVLLGLVNLLSRGRRMGDSLVRVMASCQSLGPSLIGLYHDWSDPIDIVRSRHRFSSGNAHQEPSR